MLKVGHLIGGAITEPTAKRQARMAARLVDDLLAHLDEIGAARMLEKFPLAVSSLALYEVDFETPRETLAAFLTRYTDHTFSVGPDWLNAEPTPLADAHTSDPATLADREIIDELESLAELVMGDPDDVEVVYDRLRALAKELHRRNDARTAASLS